MVPLLIVAPYFNNLIIGNLDNIVLRSILGSRDPLGGHAAHASLLAGLVDPSRAGMIASIWGAHGNGGGEEGLPPNLDS